MKKRLLYIGNQLSSKKDTVTTIETLSGLLRNEGYQIIVASSIQNKALRMLDMLRKTFKNRNKLDVVLIDTYSTQNFYYAVGVAKLCRVFKIPYIPILHGGNLPNRLKNCPRLSQQLIKGAKTNVSPSNYLIEAFKKGGYSNLTYIPNSIEIDNYPYLQREEIKAKLLWVRSFSEIYNPLLAIEIVEKLLDNNIAVELCMIGPEKDRSLKKCKEIVAQRNLPITFTGLLPKKEWITQSKGFDIFINTTNFDNTPVSVIEAMALGIPVISTDVGGIPFLIEHQKTGVLVPPMNAQLFVNEIIELLNHPEKAKGMAGNARKEVEKFDWLVVRDLWKKLLK